MNSNRSLISLCAVLLALGLSSLARAEEVGSVMLSAGSAFVDTAGVSHAAASGMKVAEGDALRTGKDGYLYIQTRDGGFFILRPGSAAKVVVFHFDPKEPQKSQVKIELDGGVARMVTGEASKQARTNFRMNTPVAAIGVRGTDFTVFADETVMRASVRSGGIVVGAFDNGCARSGNGPCGGDSARVLMAGSEPLVVEVQRGDKQPRVLKSEQLLPDRIAPPGQNEPTEKHSAAANPPTEAQYVTSNTSMNKTMAVLDPAKLVSDALPDQKPPPDVTSVVPTPSVPDPTHAVPLPPVVIEPTPPVVVTPPPPLITWGRWQPIADLPANMDLVSALGSNKQLIALSTVQALFRDNREPVAMPNEGQANFTLSQHEGFFRNETNGQAIAAQAGNASLSIDFGRRTFATSLDLAGGSLSTQVRANGFVGGDGTFQSDALAPASVTGALAGSAAKEAGYIYHQRVNGQITVDGATYWTR